MGRFNCSETRHKRLRLNNQGPPFHNWALALEKLSRQQSALVNSRGHPLWSGARALATWLYLRSAQLPLSLLLHSSRQLLPLLQALLLLLLLPPGPLLQQSPRLLSHHRLLMLAALRLQLVAHPCSQGSLQRAKAHLVRYAECEAKFLTSCRLALSTLGANLVRAKSGERSLPTYHCPSVSHGQCPRG